MENKKEKKIDPKRYKYAISLLKEMEKLKEEKNLSPEDEIEYKGRALNVILRGYDVPLQGSTMNTIKLKNLTPQPYFFERKGFHKLV